MCEGIEVIAVRAVVGVCCHIDNDDAVCLVVTSSNTAASAFIIIIGRNMHTSVLPSTPMKMGGSALQAYKYFECSWLILY